MRWPLAGFAASSRISCWYEQGKQHCGRRHCQEDAIAAGARRARHFALQPIFAGYRIIYASGRWAMSRHTHTACADLGRQPKGAAATLDIAMIASARSPALLGASAARTAQYSPPESRTFSLQQGAIMTRQPIAAFSSPFRADADLHCYYA